jgi:hypothetical protein
MKQFLFATLLCAIGHCALGADTDGDGRLDLVDVPSFNPNATGILDFFGMMIQDLDGANQLTNAQELLLHDNQITGLENGDFQGLSNLQTLGLLYNQITSLENGDFQGLSNLQELNLHGNQIKTIEIGAFRGLDNLPWLALSGNQITSLENGAFQGLSTLQRLDLWGNQITSLENGAFQGLSTLHTLNLRGNNITEMNLTSATFGSLWSCGVFSRDGFCVDAGEITDLILDDAVLNQGSFQAIVGATGGLFSNVSPLITNVSLVGLAFSDGNPADLSALLNISTLDNVRVDQALFDRYAAEFVAFDALPGNTVTVANLPAGLPDYDASGLVEQADLDLVLLNWGTELASPAGVGWINDFPSGPVDQGELDKVLLNWGAATALTAAAVPEPSTLALVLLATGLGLCRCCRR